MSQCPECGTASVREDQRFCARCGTDLTAGDVAAETAAAVEPPPAWGGPPRITGPLFVDDAPPTQATSPAMVPPPPQPGYPQPAFVPPPQPAASGPGRRRTPILLLAVAALVAALIGAGGVVLLLGGDDEPASDTTAEDRRDDAGTTTDADESPSTTAPTASDTVEPATFRCWDGGAAVELLESCRLPTGADGMAWVFPSSDDPACFTQAGGQRVTEADCTATVAGAAVRIHYSEWRTRAALEGYYGGLTVGPIDPPDGRDDLTAVQVVSRDSDVGYKVAIYYTSAAGLWSVTVYAADETQYLAALPELEIRPFGRLRGQPS